MMKFITKFRMITVRNIVQLEMNLNVATSHKVKWTIKIFNSQIHPKQAHCCVSKLDAWRRVSGYLYDTGPLPGAQRWYAQHLERLLKCVKNEHHCCKVQWLILFAQFLSVRLSLNTIDFTKQSKSL